LRNSSFGPTRARQSITTVYDALLGIHMRSFGKPNRMHCGCSPFPNPRSPRHLPDESGGRLDNALASAGETQLATAWPGFAQFENPQGRDNPGLPPHRDHVKTLIECVAGWIRPAHVCAPQERTSGIFATRIGNPAPRAKPGRTGFLHENGTAAASFPRYGPPISASMLQSSVSSQRAK
jgi:hypothetical protein